MPLLPSVAVRDRQDELMDDPQLSGERHDAALRGLSRLNRIGGSSRVVWRPIAQLAKERGLKKLRVLDVATGSGDIPITLWKKARHSDLELEILGVDISPRAIENSQQRAEAAGASVTFAVHDALGDDLPKDYDVITTSTFTHHLENDDVARLLSNMARSAKQLVLVNDLIRSRWNLLMVHFAGHLVTRSDVVHVDGPLSVRAAFTVDEFQMLADRAGLDGAKIFKRWPCRFLLQWRKE
jgi:2-polyprenyl-3-methyl-5-hydroxy-6-metoxy-1,4-benzoquinol methylase